MQKRKSQACLIVLLLLGVFCILSVTINSNQAMMSIPLPQIFTGTYCVNGGEPEPLLENTKLSAMDGDVVLKGHFSFGIPEGAILNFYGAPGGARFLRVKVPNPSVRRSIGVCYCGFTGKMI